MDDIRKRIRQERIYFDGGSGTLLQEMGLKAGELPETWNLKHPDRVLKLYEGYLKTGCDVFNTNTFGANRLKYPDNLKEVVESAVCLAKQAREETGREDACIALDIGPTGKLLKPMGDLDFEDAVRIFGEVARLGAEAGADLILIETMADSYEVKAAVLGAKENCDLPVFVTMVFDEGGKMLTGGTPESMTAILEGLRVDALGINCSLGPRQMMPIVQRFLNASSLPVIVNPNAGLPRSENGKTVYDIGPEEFSDLMAEMAELGAQGIGGCCGTTPEHIRLTIEKCQKIPFVPPSQKHHTIVTSFSQLAEIGPKPLIIGERINPTGKKRFKKALVDHDLDYVLQQGLSQEDAGAHILDVNVGLPEIDEVQMLSEVIQKLQSVTLLPLQIDTSNTEAMAGAMRIYNGKPMVNSVNGKEESMRAVFPLVRKYGGVVVALLLDEDGIPDTAQKRLDIAQKILEIASEYGISQDDIVFDALSLTISSDSTSAQVTLEALRRLRDEMHAHSILGVSNISFGLPQRQLINANFFTMAMQSGLSCGIINPNNRLMMSSYYSYLALAGLDPQCTGYIEKYGAMAPLSLNEGGPSASPVGSGIKKNQASGEHDALKENGQQADSADEKKQLGEYIEQGMDGLAGRAAEELLSQSSADPLELVNGQIIPALNLVGERFEKGTLFLPQLLMSAEAAKAAFEVVKKHMPQTDGAEEKRHKIILATVKGDIHDIGKNIVKVLLENYGYHVVDLGRDVDPEIIVQTALDQDIRVVGLSALMTTTVVSMEETIRQLREKKPDTKIVVGGAVMNQDYADQIGADCYAKDAMSTVRYADRIFGEKR